ncbi:PREDICTED: uncharacterized protein LOC106805075 [Priapulus caudatus]|uniref:Uncharacterized protein LOC106805075 n=1 Tax=Priapulus caudatus TaxID=37621 RepID=A0ABM1DQ18_PRICU|nr:PREDICTED: uncharacterized protein LOC106805075 [Priapulus caudatus]
MQTQQQTTQQQTIKKIPNPCQQQRDVCQVHAPRVGGGREAEQASPPERTRRMMKSGSRRRRHEGRHRGRQREQVQERPGGRCSDCLGTVVVNLPDTMLLFNYLTQATAARRESVPRLHGFYLIANQLYRTRADAADVDAALSSCLARLRYEAVSVRTCQAEERYNITYLSSATSDDFLVNLHRVAMMELSELSDESHVCYLMQKDLARLWVGLLHPSHPLGLQEFILRSIISEPRCKDILDLLILHNPLYEEVVVACLWRITHNPVAKSQPTAGVSLGSASVGELGATTPLTRADVGFKLLDVETSMLGVSHTHGKVMEAVTEKMSKDTGILLHVLSERDPVLMLGGLNYDTIDDSLTRWREFLMKKKAQWSKENEPAEKRIAQKYSALSNLVTSRAMAVTQTVVASQNMQRKQFFEQAKVMRKTTAQVDLTWSQLIAKLSHERAVWFDEKCYPKCWKLDPSEGACRERIRTQYAYVGIASKYFMDQYKHRLDAEHHGPPLGYLTDSRTTLHHSKAILHTLHTNEKISFHCKCYSVSPFAETAGELLVGELHLHFVIDEIRPESATLVQDYMPMLGMPHISSQFEDLMEVHKRRYQLKDNALELFLCNGNTFLLAFESTKDRDKVYQELLGRHLPNLADTDRLSSVQQQWMDGAITNFEYLTQLNKMAGRSFNDLMQYPVFPFILAQYNWEYLDLEDPAHFRSDLGVAAGTVSACTSVQLPPLVPTADPRISSSCPPQALESESRVGAYLITDRPVFGSKQTATLAVQALMCSIPAVRRTLEPESRCHRGFDGKNSNRN